MGLMNLLGYGRPQDIELAMHYFQREHMKKDPRALNAIGYVYFHAPDVFEEDPAITNTFGKIKRNY